MLQHVCRLGAEGIVSKRRDGPYLPRRTTDWMKSKCANRQEFVVLGYVPSTTAHKAIGSLVLGYYDKGKLVHAGRVGTGFSNKVAADLYAELSRERSPSRLWRHRFRPRRAATSYGSNQPASQKQNFAAGQRT